MKKFGIQPRIPIKVPNVAPEAQPVITTTETETVVTIPEIETVMTTTEPEPVVATHQCPTCSQLFAILKTSSKLPM
jgi:hypothetical protein